MPLNIATFLSLSLFSCNRLEERIEARQSRNGIEVALIGNRRYEIDSVFFDLVFINRSNTPVSVVKLVALKKSFDFTTTPPVDFIVVRERTHPVESDMVVCMPNDSISIPVGFSNYAQFSSKKGYSVNASFYFSSFKDVAPDTFSFLDVRFNTK